MKILVTGSRSWDDFHRIYEILSLYPPSTQLIHGGAKGADSLAALAAEYLFVPDPICVKPDWEAHGRSAGIRRNNDMLNMAPDEVLAFWDGSSRGTKHTITMAQKLAIPTHIYLLHS